MHQKLFDNLQTLSIMSQMIFKILLTVIDTSLVWIKLWATTTSNILEYLHESLKIENFTNLVVAV